MSEPPTDRIPHFVPSIDQRYGSANIEKAARIQARQLVQMSFTLLLSGLVAAMLGAKFPLDASDARDIHHVLLGIGVPVFGLVVTAWVSYQDYLIGLLDAYCMALEVFGREWAPAGPKAPAWHDPKLPWYSSGYACRFWANNAFGVVLLATSLPSTIVIYYSGHKREAVFLLAVLFLVALLLRAFLIPRGRRSDLRVKQHCVSALLAGGCAVFGYFSLTLRKAEFHNPKLDYYLFVGALGILVIAGAISLFIFIERKRFVLMTYSRYDPNEGSFIIDYDELADHDAVAGGVVRRLLWPRQPRPKLLAGAAPGRPSAQDAGGE
jgi:FtsH-binding integral membrane protein